MAIPPFSCHPLLLQVLSQGLGSVVCLLRFFPVLRVSHSCFSLSCLHPPFPLSCPLFSLLLLPHLLLVWLANLFREHPTSLFGEELIGTLRFPAGPTYQLQLGNGLLWFSPEKPRSPQKGAGWTEHGVNPRCSCQLKAWGALI